MLHEILTSNRDELVQRCKDKAARRFAPTKVPAEINHGVPLFLQQLTDTLRLEQTTSEREPENPLPSPSPSEVGRAAAVHGAELLDRGYTVDQVVHDYGDVCQSVTDLAIEQKEIISSDEFRTLNRCLDNAIADAVESYGRVRQVAINDQAESLHTRLDAFTLEHQRLVDIAIKAYSAIRTGNVGLTGATGTLLLHSLEELRTLAERKLPGVRLASAMTTFDSAATK